MAKVKKEDEIKSGGDGISSVADVRDIRPKELPLIITLAPDASKAQIERAKVLNGFAYQNPDKWEAEKDDRTHTDEFGRKALIKGHLTLLKELKNAPDPVEDPNLKFPNRLAA